MTAGRGAIRKVARLGHPVLRKPARELSAEEIRSPGTERLIADMVETMREYGGIGLAAPQVHESVQLAIIELGEDSARYPGMGSQPLSVFVNPRITVTDPAEQAFWEGCLSIPELRGLVHRPRGVRVDYLDEEARPRSIEAQGFLATVLQHELDHLAGRLFVDRIRDTTQLAFLEEYRRYVLPAQQGPELGD
jgi:peptide deformylase